MLTQKLKTPHLYNLHLTHFLLTHTLEFSFVNLIDKPVLVRTINNSKENKANNKYILTF